MTSLENLKVRICNTILVEGLILLYIKKKKTCIEDFPKEKKNSC